MSVRHMNASDIQPQHNNREPFDQFIKKIQATAKQPPTTEEQRDKASIERMYEERADQIQPPATDDRLPCGCTIEPDDAMKSSVFWNPFNKVVQCHQCGHVYEPTAPATDDKPQRPQPDARVEKALRDYDEGLALDSIVTTNSEAYKNGTITPTEQGSHAVGQEQRYEGEAIRKTGQQRPMFNDLTQEWFLNETKIILDLGICQLGFSKNEVTRLKQIVDAHNAALSAHEQAWVKVLNNIASEYAQDMIVAQVELDKLVDALKELRNHPCMTPTALVIIDQSIADAKTDRA